LLTLAAAATDEIVILLTPLSRAIFIALRTILLRVDSGAVISRLLSDQVASRDLRT
jgi:H2-forming N5,N10-methylenetetrahydromethanopterin dehydrogenase-like enzyme